MKKIFTAIAALALTATAANAAITVEYEGKQLANGEEIIIGNDGFKYEAYEFEDFSLYWWESEALPTVNGNKDMTANVEATIQGIQFCPTGNCIPSRLDDATGLWLIKDATMPASPFQIQIHCKYDGQELPDETNYLKCTLSDADGDFVFTIKYVTTASSGVNEIVAGSEKKVAAIYDLQGRRVREDYRGAAIVVYDNGEAVKRIVK